MREGTGDSIQKGGNDDLNFLHSKLVDAQIQFSCWYLVHIKHAKCFICGEPAVLELEENKYVCENCAQICGEKVADQESQI